MGNRDLLLKEISGAIKDKYGSLEAPQFHFVGSALEENPYEAIISALSKQFDVEECTDPNYDVAFFYNLRKDTHEWLIGLSMVGKFAVLLKTVQGKVHLIESETIMENSEVYILDLLIKHKIDLLGRKVLEIPIRMSLSNCEITETKIYQTLFSDSSVLPWH